MLFFAPLATNLNKTFSNSSMKYKKLLPIVKYDDYIKEWDYEKNKDHNPNTLTAGSSHKVVLQDLV